MQRVFVIHNVENTKSWEDNAGNTQKLGNSNLASPPLLYFRALFLCIHHQQTTNFTPLKVSHLPPLKKCLVVGILNLFTFMSLWESMKL